MSLSEYSKKAGHLIAESLGMLLGVAPPKDAWLAFAVQVRREVADGSPTASGTMFNNPLNLTTAGGTISWPGQTGAYSGGDVMEWHGDFAAFGTLEAGCWACASNYDGGSYPGVIAAFRGGDPRALARAIQESPWDSGHYGGTLVDDVVAELGGDVPITRDQYAAEIEPLVKETMRVMIEQDGETRQAIAGVAPSPDIGTVVKAIGQKLTQ